MARVQSVGYQVNQIIKEINGIRESKRENRANSQKIGENGHKVSTKVHSYKSLDNIRADLTNLGKFSKQNFGMKELKDINKEVVKNWIESKNITYSTATNYFSEINKVNDFLSISREDIKELRSHFKQHLPAKTSLAKESRAYSERLLEKIKLGPKSDIAFRLQKNYGLRLKEATHINLNRQLKDPIENILEIQGKGGKTIQIKIDNKLMQDIKAQAEKGIFKVNQTTYRQALKEQILKNREEWKGTHGLRHSFAQNKLEQGYTKEEVSQAMGHTREEITNTYLR